jgi:hypothetical protein
MHGYRMRRVGLACASAALLGLGTACSNHSGLSHNLIAEPAENVIELTVDSGLPHRAYYNGVFATVTVCVPDTSDCQSIEHVLVDTGSMGLRLLGSALTLSLPAWTDDNGVALAECTQFISAFLWGSLRSADVRMAGEQANRIAIQVLDGQVDESTPIEGPPYPVPKDCTGYNASNADGLGANGILGVSTFVQDCGPHCAATPGPTSSNPGLYYSCSSARTGDCQAAAVPLARQVSNPVALFSQDNNGTIVELPEVPAAGAASVVGSLVFGIGTRDNNTLGRATVIKLDSRGDFRTQYPTNGSPSSAFVDSGSNAIFFLSSGTTKIPACEGLLFGFYCPSSTLDLSARNRDVGGAVAVDVKFSIANAIALFGLRTNYVFDNLGGPSAAPSSGTGVLSMAYFDWGLPFFFGRNVFTAIEEKSTPGGTGPFVAF